MDKEPRGLFHPIPSHPISALTALHAILVAVSMSSGVAAQEGSISLSSAAEQGTFNVGAAHAVLSRVYDPAVGSEVLSLTYAIPESSAAGIYAKGFPPG